MRTGQHVFKRHRSTKSRQSSSKPRPKSDPLSDFLNNSSFRRSQKSQSSFQQGKPFVPFDKPIAPGEGNVFLPISHKNSAIPHIALDEIIPYFEAKVYSWASSARTKDRLSAFGIPDQDIPRLLDAFIEDVESGLLSDPQSITYYGLERFSHPHDTTSIDVIYSTIFFSWASRPDNEVILEDEFHVSPNTIHFIQRLVKATSRLHPADEWPEARTLNRKVIMHVGPTNSGKTHHALRALAAAKTGVYAGPLRLLAYEIWQRLNTGQIIPLGTEEDPSQPRSLKGNPLYSRPCNMVTGEEQRIVGEDVPLTSCTVEMMNYSQIYDVAVIDEIQMINSPSRGGSWTNAVIGLPARELHLCGEETAVPIVEAMLKHTGDELEVRRYERLTPLVVEEESLNGDLNKVREGDCIVAFSRSKIFELKKSVEAKTGLRCAVIYGRLPPEVRSEQAALFNDPDSGYDVLIGSDAIGMGLNLCVLHPRRLLAILIKDNRRIKRVIFEAMHKFSEGGKRLLSTSSIKQIGGRAGRYGLHQSQNDQGGFVTTLHPDDLRHAVRWLSAPYEPLTYATIPHTPDLLQETLSILPAGSSISLALLAPKYIGRLPPYMRYETHDQFEYVSTLLDNEWSDMSIEDKVVILHAPIPWSDQKCLQVVKRMLSLHSQEFKVNIRDCIVGTNFMDTLVAIENKMADEEKRKAKASKATYVAQPATLMIMESFHKLLVFYLWMSYKNPTVYSDATVSLLKERAEKVLNWTLEHMSKGNSFRHLTKKTPLRVDEDPKDLALEVEEVLDPRLAEIDPKDIELVEDESEVR
ncbi:hypothetical protein CVT26_012241 [Gymnopilus dilepis]|uniref:RNA helicase n=1 Tax=Gymnopilus dilepis TaxID=231916 RepID=A0A409YQ64_9AGAR|nr:hypothetical protein CVT26_012241 [Gymnopilus dilepis]